MVALAATFFVPILTSGTLFGRRVEGFEAALGLDVLVGAFLFGIGMQLGGGCASGTLYSAGAGNPRMLVTLGRFIAGSVLGAAHSHRWAALPAWRSISLLEEFGPAGALALTVCAAGAIAGAKSRPGMVETRALASKPHRRTAPRVNRDTHAGAVRLAPREGTRDDV